MLKKVVRVMKKIVVSGLIIYAYNVLVTPINATIPFNFITLLLVSLFGIPSLVGLVLLMLLFY